MIVFESSYNYHGHLGASYSNIGHIQTKENIVVGTLLIGTLPNSLGGWSYSNPTWSAWSGLWSYLNLAVKQYDHLGASCSNIGRIQTKENIAVGTLLIGATPKPLGATWSYSNPSLTPLERFTDRIRIGSFDFLFVWIKFFEHNLLGFETFCSYLKHISVVSFKPDLALDDKLPACDNHHIFGSIGF